MDDDVRDRTRGRVGGIAFELWPAAAPAAGTPVVLIGGADTPGASWPDRFCRRVAAAGYPVVTFDHREVGDSAGEWPGYDLVDMVADVVAVTDAATGASQAHLIGSSLGGMIAQMAALDGRARSLVLIASSPGPGAGCGPPAARYLEALAELAFSEGLSEVDVVVGSARLLAGDRYRFEEPAHHGPPPATRHASAVERTPPWHGRLGEIEVPTLVVHGAADPLFPPEHGRYLAGAIGSAELVELDGLGHEAPPALFDELGDRILAHLARS